MGNITDGVETKEYLEILSDSRRLKAGPLLLTSSIEPVEEVLVISNHLTAHFVAELERILPQTGARLRPIPFEGEAPHHDVWIQDSVEIGRMIMHTCDRVEQVTAMLTGIRAKHEGGVNGEHLDHQMRAYFQNLGVIVLDVTSPRTGTRWIDWYGNLEVSPPVKARNGRKFPFGRVLTGVQRDLGIHPDVLAFLDAQHLQTPPLVIDTSWLLIGHVDEVVNFVPAPKPPGFCVLVPSPSFARTLLENAALQGLSNQAVFAGHSGETPVAKLLEDVAMSEENNRICEILQEIRARICEGLGVDDEHFIEIPVLFRNGGAVIPNCVNGLICNGHAILPAPLGPRVDGDDAFAAPIRAALTRLGVNVHFVDVWDAYHIRGGEIHCGTNTIRRIQGTAWREIGQS